MCCMRGTEAVYCCGEYTLMVNSFFERSFVMGTQGEDRGGRKNESLLISEERVWEYMCSGDFLIRHGRLTIDEMRVVALKEICFRNRQMRKAG